MFGCCSELVTSARTGNVHATFSLDSSGVTTTGNASRRIEVQCQCHLNQDLLMPKCFPIFSCDAGTTTKVQCGRRSVTGKWPFVCDRGRSATPWNGELCHPCPLNVCECHVWVPRVIPTQTAWRNHPESPPSPPLPRDDNPTTSISLPLVPCATPIHRSFVPMSLWTGPTTGLTERSRNGHPPPPLVWVQTFARTVMHYQPHTKFHTGRNATDELKN